MKPYYEHAGVTIYHGDCLEVLPTLGTFDLLLTDPPYGLGNKMQGGTWGAAQKYGQLRSWDVKPNAEMIGVLLNKCGIAIIWGGNYFALTPSRCWLSWSKSNAIDTMADFELAWTNLDRPSKEWRGPVATHTHGHPTQKPEALMRWCFKFAPDATSVLDPFMGSGTTLVAAKRLGRRAVGIEREEKYCEIAAERLSQESLPLEMP